jgi:Fe-S-cluster-containing dehydrogenase component
MKRVLKINTERCMGCCACEITCKMEYQLPKGLRFIVMRETEAHAPDSPWS